MSQLTLFGDPSPSPRQDTKQPPAEVVKHSVKINGLAIRCREAAELLEKHIEADHTAANRTFALRPTRRQLQQAIGHRQRAWHFQKIHDTLRKLADMHEDGTITPDVVRITTAAAVERALREPPAGNTIRSLYESMSCIESKAQLAARLQAEASLKGIPGFFATPPETAEQLVRFARFGRPRTLFEPSAGGGALIDTITTHHPETKISYCEIHCFLLEILQAKYEEEQNVHFAGRDFLELEPTRTGESFAAIIMNPPFEQSQDMQHILHAYRFLDRGGILAAIVSDGAFSRQSTKATEFRRFLESHNAATEKLPTHAFKASGTQVSCRMIRITRGL